jgi:hypothetical protein
MHCPAHYTGGAFYLMTVRFWDDGNSYSGHFEIITLGEDYN